MSHAVAIIQQLCFCRENYTFSVRMNWLTGRESIGHTSVPGLNPAHCHRVVMYCNKKNKGKNKFSVACRHFC